MSYFNFRLLICSLVFTLCPQSHLSIFCSRVLTTLNLVLSCAYETSLIMALQIHQKLPILYVIFSTNVSGVNNVNAPNVMMSGYGVDTRDSSYPAYLEDVPNYPNYQIEANRFPFYPMKDEGSFVGGSQTIPYNNNGNSFITPKPYFFFGNRGDQLTEV